MIPMTVEQVAAILAAAGLRHESVQPIHKYDTGAPVAVGVTVYLNRDGTWAYDALAKAAAALGTTNINFRWRSEEGDLSDVTPGDPSEHVVDIRW